MKIVTFFIACLFFGIQLFAQNFLELINKHRKSLRITTLTIDSTLTRMARHHTAYLTSLKIEPTHTEDISVDGMITLKELDDRFNYYSSEISTTICWSECLSYFKSKSIQPNESYLRHFKNLLNSTPHREIIEDPLITKIGFSESFYQQTTIDSAIYKGRLITGKNTYNVYTITVCFGK